MKTVNNLDFELWYDDNFCASFTSLDKAIKQAVDTYKANDHLWDRSDYYYIKLNYSVIVTIKVVDGKIVIE